MKIFNQVLVIGALLTSSTLFAAGVRSAIPVIGNGTAAFTGGDYGVEREACVAGTSDLAKEAMREAGKLAKLDCRTKGKKAGPVTIIRLLDENDASGDQTFQAQFSCRAIAESRCK